MRVTFLPARLLDGDWFRGRFGRRLVALHRLRKRCLGRADAREHTIARLDADFSEVVTHAEATGYMPLVGLSTGWRTTGTHNASYCAGFEDSRET